MSTLVSDKTLKGSYYYFVIVMLTMFPGALLLFGTFNAIYFFASVIGVVWQVMILSRYYRRVLPWFITSVYLCLVVVLGHEILRDGIIRSGR